MRLSDFDYHLPTELIAQQPMKPRDQSRLMVVDRLTQSWQSAIFNQLPQFLQADDVLLLNNSQVLPTRLLGHKLLTGGQVEVLLERQLESTEQFDVWRCLIGASRPQIGLMIEFDQELQAKIIDDLGLGVFVVKLNQGGSKLKETLQTIGQMPLPPYIKAGSQELQQATNSYQTVYAQADQLGSAAAPTAGLHFTKELLDNIQSMGVEIIKATLHVGLGTFAPVKTDNITEHRLHEEEVEIGVQAINDLVKAHQQGRRIIAVGTTSVRILEGVVARFIEEPATTDWRAPVNLFIYPGFEFQLLGGLVTNFHLPQSSLLMLVSAWTGNELIKQVYQSAIEQKYRFFSYGDAMFLK